MKYIFGPVPSRRLGNSLGVDLIPFKTCSFDCIYCQLGKTNNKTISRKEYIPVNTIISELKKVLTSVKPIDYLTISGSGEPTLNSRIGKIIREIKKITALPVAVLTNSSLLSQENVREKLKKADLLIPSLDSAIQSTFEQINRPFKGLRIEQIINGIKLFSKDFQGNMFLEIMLVKGINDSTAEIKRLAEAVREINPDKVQLNTIVRPPAERTAKPLTETELNSIKDLIGERVEIVSKQTIRQVSTIMMETESEIIKIVCRRPTTLSDLSNSLGIKPAETAKYIDALTQKGLIEYKLHGKEIFYQAYRREIE
ncbi:MAG: radical SAM protein [Deltaproteobacteria bacterium]|nr:MAG: radical SAM protein [Deltaproteobacteria bacterium]